ncbi:unnamed protein product, partial [Strongylus vulgaris]
MLDENGGGMAGNDLRTLIESRIPEHRTASSRVPLATFFYKPLLAGPDNLTRIDCDRNVAFEETKQFALQSLASVAYQINTLARDLLDMLDLQTDKISSLTSQVDNIDVVVNIHKEKLARREIGALTTNKSLQKQPKIIAPAAQVRRNLLLANVVVINALHTSSSSYSSINVMVAIERKKELLKRKFSELFKFRQHMTGSFLLVEPTQRYKRTPIDFSVLDGIGH